MGEEEYGRKRRGGEGSLSERRKHSAATLCHPQLDIHWLLYFPCMQCAARKRSSATARDAEEAPDVSRDSRGEGRHESGKERRSKKVLSCLCT